MPRDGRRHAVVEDSSALLEALAAPFGTYVGVAVCRAAPGARTLSQLAVDLACAVGKTDALTRGGGDLDRVELWFRAHQVEALYVTGADALEPEALRALCGFASRVWTSAIFVSSEPSARAAEHQPMLDVHRDTYLRVDPERFPVRPPVNAPLPRADFPFLPAACRRSLDPEHAEMALAIYDECLVAAFEALPSERLIGPEDADFALRAALARAPDLSAAPLAMHALRAAGLLHGHDIRFVDDERVGGVAFEALLTADRLDQLGRMLDPEAAMAGLVAGLPDAWSRPAVQGRGHHLRFSRAQHRVSDRLAAIVRAWSEVENDPRSGSRRRPPARRPDPRDRQPWRTPPPGVVRHSCQPIECDNLRFVADARMEWAWRGGDGVGAAPTLRSG